MPTSGLCLTHYRKKCVSHFIVYHLSKAPHARRDQPLLHPPFLPRIANNHFALIDLGEYHPEPRRLIPNTLPTYHLRRPQEIQVLLLVRVSRFRRPAPVGDR